MTILLLTLTGLFLLICWNRLRDGVLVMLALLPAYLLRTELFGIPTNLLELMLVSVVGVWLVQNRHRLRELFGANKQWALAIAFMILAATVSAIVSPDTLSALGIWKSYFIEPVLFFYLLKDLLGRGAITSTHIARAIILGGIWVSLLALTQWILQTGIPIPWDIERRVTGVFDYPNALGLYLGPLAVLCFALSCNPACPPKPWRRWDGAQRPKYLMVGMLFLLTIILAQSEAAIAALIITLIVGGLFIKKFRKRTALVVIVLSLVSLTVPFSRSYLIEKITLQDYSGQVRLSQWQETWELLKDRPIFGAGLSGYPSALVPYHKATHIEIFQYPHNIFLNIWVELGLLGLFAFALLALVLLRSLAFSVRLHHSITPSLLPIAYCLLPLLHMFIHGLVDVPYFKNDLAILTWTLIAIVYAKSFSKTKTNV